MARHVRVFENADTGWSDWISPVMKRYQMACCDCGLVHTLRLRVMRVTRYLEHGRWKASGPVAGVRVQFQAKRDNRATAQVRRHRKKSPQNPRT